MSEQEKTIDSKEEATIIRRIALAAFGLNLVLAVVKGWLAISSGSIAITAGVVDSASDCVASLAVFIGVVLSTRKTAKFPLGLYKIENLISVVVAIFIFVAGYEIARTVFLSETVTLPTIALRDVIILAISTAVIFAFGKFALDQGRRTGSPTLTAEGKHRQVDTISSLIVLLSAAFGYLGIDASIAGISVDKAAAVLVILFIVKAGWELLSDGMRVLLDASLEPEVLDEVKEIIRTDRAVAEVRSVVGRNAGRFRFLQANVSLRAIDLERAHFIADRLEHKIADRIPRVERVVIHYEPIQKNALRIAIPLKSDRTTPSPHFGEAQYFAFLEIPTTSPTETLSESGPREEDRRRASENTGSDGASPESTRTQPLIEPNPNIKEEKQKGIKTAEWLIRRDVDILCLPGELKNKGPLYTLSDAGIEVRQITGSTVTEIVSQIQTTRE